MFGKTPPGSFISSKSHRMQQEANSTISKLRNKDMKEEATHYDGSSILKITIFIWNCPQDALTNKEKYDQLI